MAGFSNDGDIVRAISEGRVFPSSVAKNFNPTTAAVAGEWHTMFRGGGNPGADAIFDAGANLTFQQVRDTTTNASSIQHGGDVGSNYYKALVSGSLSTGAATVAPATIALVDVLGFYRVTTVTTTTAQATTNPLTAFSTFTADAGTDILTHLNNNLFPYTRVQLTTTTTLPTGLALATDYYVIKVTDTTCKLATSYANAVAGTAIDILTAGVGTHTINTVLPRYTNGAGVQAIFFNPSATPLGAATPNLSLGYTNSLQATGRATPTVLPIGKTAASNSLILASGTGVGKYNFTHPQQSGDAGIAEINTIRNSTSYVSGSYSVALIKELTRFPVNILGQATERNLVFEFPSLPRIYDGAAVYPLIGSGLATPVNSGFSALLNFVWN